MQPQDREYLLKNKNSCFVVQLLMTYLPPEQRTKLAHILMEVEDEERAVKLTKELMVDACGSRSLEVMVRAASEENVNRFFKSVVLENITEYAGNPRSNYVVQMFLSRVTDKALVGPKDAIKRRWKRRTRLWTNIWRRCITRITAGFCSSC